MIWKPITKEGLQIVLQDTLHDMPDDLKKIFQDKSTPLMRIPCRRGNAKTLDHVFVIAEFANLLLIFDDVEDEFAVVSRPTDGSAITGWSLFPDLNSAFREMICTADSNLKCNASKGHS